MFYKAYSLEKLRSMNISKRDLVSIMGIESETFDYALPQQWLDNFVDNLCEISFFEDMERGEIYSLVLSTTFWIYPKSLSFGGAISGCMEIAERLPAIGCRWNDISEEIASA
jgi:hypothetical protein